MTTYRGFLFVFLISISLSACAQNPQTRRSGLGGLLDRANQTLNNGGGALTNDEIVRGLKEAGLKNIQKRAEISNLKLTIDSTPAGTNFIIETLPV